MHQPKHIAEYICLRAIAMAVNVLPESAGHAMGGLVARVLYRISRRRREETARRIRQVLGDDLPDAEVNRIGSRAFCDLVWHMLEILRTPKMNQRWIERHVVLEDDDRERLENELAGGKGVIIAVPHLANWDLAGVGLQEMGYPMTFIVRHQKNPLFDAFLNRMREHRGSDVIERDDKMLVRHVTRALKSGRVVAILIDLRARQSDLRVPFLGHEADLGRGVGLISHISNSPVVPAFTTRRPDGKHQFHFCSPVYPDRTKKRNEDAERILREAIPPLEAAIRKHPEQYFWFNKRWVLERIESG